MRARSALTSGVSAMLISFLLVCGRSWPTHGRTEEEWR
jgi:hypothetical protein